MRTINLRNIYAGLPPFDCWNLRFICQKVAVTKRSEIRRPQTFYFAISVLVGIVIFLAGANSANIDLKIFLALIGFLVPIVVAICLKKPKLSASAPRSHETEQK